MLAHVVDARPSPSTCPLPPLMPRLVALFLVPWLCHLPPSSITLANQYALGCHNWPMASRYVGEGRRGGRGWVRVIEEEELGGGGDEVGVADDGMRGEIIDCDVVRTARS
jgi:hypothetical protein